MNKKLLIATLSLAALAACTNDDFQSQNAASVAEETSPVKFKLVNDNDGTRASMNGNTIVWNANDGDLFSLYHGSADLTVAPQGFQNATYKAIADESGATLSTPSMVLEGGAVMVWPVDSVFRITSADGLTIVIPDEQTDIANQIPYVSDGIAIAAYDPTGDGAQIGWKNTAGLDREYPVYMRPMASQLIVNADYDGTDAQIAELYTGEDAIEPISVTSVQLTTTAAQGFTTEIPVTFTAASPADEARWDANVPENAWSHVTGLDRANATDVATLTTKCLTDNASSKFLILPQPVIIGGLGGAAVTVNTIYGKVFVADPADYPGVSKYTTTQYNDAWYRYVTDPTTVDAAEETAAAAAEASGDHAGKYKVTANQGPRFGLMQTINFFGDYTVPATSTSTVATEYMGVATQRYVTVDLTKLDMSDLHIKNDKQLRDAARVWNKMGLDDVVVYLDGDDDEEFAISQETITYLNELNHDALGNYVSHFEVMPCDVAGEECETIVITGGGDVQDMAFIKDNAGKQAKVAFNEGETWAWKGTVMVDETGVFRIYNRGTMVNDAAGESTLKTVDVLGAPNDVRLVNLGTWNITRGTVFVQFDVTNQKTMEISKGAEYRQDGTGHDFYNWANAKPTRFGGDDEVNGLITNKGVFATVNGGKIHNQALIEHADKDAKTYISTNQTGGANFANPFGGGNKMGRLNLPYSNKDEDNISITSALDQGFVSVTVDGEVAGALDAGVLGSKVNYVIIKSGVTEINKVAGTVKYLEINEPGTEIAWKVSETGTYDGLMVLSNVNITQSTNVTVTKATYLGATMYVGGVFTNAGWSGYYGDTSDAFTTKYVTY